MVSTSGEHILVEIAASVGRNIVERLQRKREIYRQHTGVEPARVILAPGSIGRRRAQAVEDAGFEVIEAEDSEPS